MRRTSPGYQRKLPCPPQVASAATYVNAMSYCAARAGRLVTFKDAAAQTAIEQYFFNGTHKTTNQAVRLQRLASGCALLALGPQVLLEREVDFVPAC